MTVSGKVRKVELREQAAAEPVPDGAAKARA